MAALYPFICGGGGALKSHFPQFKIASCELSIHFYSAQQSYFSAQQSYYSAQRYYYSAQQSYYSALQSYYSVQQSSKIIFKIELKICMRNLNE